MRKRRATHAAAFSWNGQVRNLARIAALMKKVLGLQTEGDIRKTDETMIRHWSGDNSLQLFSCAM